MAGMRIDAANNLLIAIKGYSGIDGLPKQLPDAPLDAPNCWALAGRPQKKEFNDGDSHDHYGKIPSNSGKQHC